jgi:hypothetical protein
MDLLNLLKPILERLAALAVSDPECRVQLRELAFKVLALTSGGPSTPAAAPANAEPQGKAIVSAASPSVPPALAVAPAPSVPPAPLPPPVPPAPVLETRPPPAPARLPAAPLERDTRPAPRDEEPPRPAPPATPYIPAWQWHDVKAEELPLIEQRCRLKAEAARWAGARQRARQDEGGPAANRDDGYAALIGRAKELPDCYLWMCNPDIGAAADPGPYADLAGCYEAAGAAALAVHHVLQHPEAQDSLPPAMFLLAEAQSALKHAVAALDTKPDFDQNRLFYWLRATAEEEHILIPRYMRVDDPANPKGWRELFDRVRHMEEKTHELQERKRRTRKRLDKLRYHAGRIRDGRGDDGAYDWERVIATVDELVSEGMPPSAREIRELILPTLDELPEAVELPKTFQLVMREADRYLAGLRGAAPEAASAGAPSEQVREAAARLRGRAVVLIGGERRPYAADALIEAFQLSDLFWIEQREHQSHYPFEPYVARPEVALVLLAIRWTSHGFGEVKEFCDKYGKPLVRLPRGYNPNQVAREIVSQVGERLAAAESRVI